MSEEAEDVGDVKQVKEKKSAVKLAREREIAELHAILGTYGGRAFIWRLLEQCGVYQAASTDPHGIFRSEGKRDVGLWALEEVFTSDPAAYTIMRNEAVSRETSTRGKK